MSISALTAALAAFNLVCTGTITSEIGTRPDNTTYRVDLDARRYCMDRCLETLPIQAVTEREIIFIDRQYEDGGSHRRTVGRESGRMYDHAIVSEGPLRFEMTTNSTCAVAPFTGFPARRF